MLGMQLPQKLNIAVGGGINFQNFDNSIMPTCLEKDLRAMILLRLSHGEKIRPSASFQFWVARELGRQISVRWEFQGLFGAARKEKEINVYEMRSEAFNDAGSADFYHNLMQFRMNIAFVKSL